jgi:hypothetical protein
MLKVLLFFAVVILGVVIGIVYNKFIIKEFSETKRKWIGVFTFVFFISFAVSLFVVYSINRYTISTITTHSNKVENYIKNTFPNNDFVANGFDLKLISNNASQINNVVSEFKTLLPSHTDIGINQRIYDFIVDYAVNEMQNRLLIAMQNLQNAVDNSTNMANPFMDRNNVMTISSITLGLRNTAINYVNIISLKIGIILFIPSLIFVIFTLIFSIIKKVKKTKSRPYDTARNAEV